MLFDIGGPHTKSWLPRYFLVNAVASGSNSRMLQPEQTKSSTKVPLPAASATRPGKWECGASRKLYPMTRFKWMMMVTLQAPLTSIVYQLLLVMGHTLFKSL